ncbi:D-glycero-alpha-D-manno-heptose-1,7-bisphosphate 7-phosphatase [Bacteroidia bacterium]|nr:D-glycero-alpha-D-manno-heptose-1,7-bisphosphate 7-phosphatase [Bacteroidia bacterium]
MKPTKPYNALFLDRDGVINIQRPGDYVKSTDEFVFIDSVLEALQILDDLFEYIIIITNQRGVGRGLMSLSDLEAVHHYMTETIASNGGRIDRIYVCTETDDSHVNRKPNPGMALLAKQDFPDVDFTNSFVAGDSLSDMQFAENVGISAVLIGNKYSDKEISSLNIAAHYPDLFTFARQLKKIQ